MSITQNQQSQGQARAQGSSQMGGSASAPRPQQAITTAPEPTRSPRPPVRFTDWASI